MFKHSSLPHPISIFQIPAADSSINASPALAPHAHPHHHHHHGFRHHKLTALHDPHLSGLLSSESTESAEAVPVVSVAVNGTPGPAVDSTATPEADAPAAKVKRDASTEGVMQAVPVPLVPLCPGRVRHF